ncbi:S8 family serine peptidase [Nesterenkonia muleiensis]|uniref:S8 family serine peptidase n=1 Tax=Nesterenkonia muleiensis TaxID=2282648 RepID=UPI000E753DAF|nr:S8 family serine peptidase [Nesterenkonia muleiensis]
MARYVVTFDTSDSAVLQDDAPGLLSSQGFSTETYFPRLGIGVVEGEPDQLESLSSRCREQNRPMSYTPELTYYAITDTAEPGFEDTSELTWGLQAIGIASAQQLGQAGAGVRVAVLDTGFDAAHPDFAARTIVTESFIDGEGPDDAHGHGTHCIGTACGPWQPETGPGYGVAPESEIYSGKVLGDDGTGSDTSILAGIDWALQNDCQVISMSLGADVREVHPPYVAAGRRALESGSLIIAAAGNNAQRSEGDPGFVGAPANSPHIMAVAAVDSQLRTADFSARSAPHDGGEIDLTAPGVDVYSAWLGEERHRSISGTSMATPHVSGIAALICGVSETRGEQLWQELVTHAAALEDEDPEDVGAGLATVPEPQDR